MGSKVTLIAVLFFTGLKQTDAQVISKNSYEVAAGIQSYYAPFKHFKIQNAQPVYMAGANHALNSKQNLELGIRLGYNRNKYQGDALYIQTLFRYVPVIGKYVQPIIGTGIGYQISFYPSSSLKYDGANWVQGPKGKGVIQVPLQLGIGYRGIKTSEAFITPFVLYQVNALIRYSPDLTPLPSSNFLLGFKFTLKK